MSNLIQIVANYTRVPGDLLNSEYTLGEDLYLRADNLQVTNDTSDGILDLGDFTGVIGTVAEVPDLNVAGDRMVILLQDDTNLTTPIMRLLQAREL